VRYLVVTETTRVPVGDPAVADFLEAFVNGEGSTFAQSYDISEVKGAKTVVTAQIEEG
jgi:hypothetical protein